MPTPLIQNEIVNSIGMNLKLNPAGEFLMGSPGSDLVASNDEKPQHRVRITQPFYLGIHQVTRGQFRRFVDASGYKTEAEKDRKGGWCWDAGATKWVQDPKYTWRSPGFDQTDEHPVVNVSWNDVEAFCNALSQKEGLSPFSTIKGQTVSVPDWNGPGYRLPTEAEWEYACRAGSQTRYCFGDDEKTLGEYAWYFANSGDRTHPVGEKKPNAFGLHDMHGNVWEWCWDGYDADYYRQSPAADPRGSDQAASRVIRGGSWRFAPHFARSAYRSWYAPVYRFFYLGFRLARGQSGR
jgi:formylglycine-generating enzyme required for sulfatase activity